MKSPKRYLFRLILAALSVLMGFLLVEAALRVAYALDRKQGGNLQERLLRSNANRLKPDVEADFGDLVQSSPVSNIVYEFRPGLDCLFRGRRMTTNSRGLRDREHELRKPPNTFRIVGLGDSVMFGWAVDQTNAYLSVLERALNARPQPHPVYETLNFAVPGYNTAIEAATFEHKALAYEPDLVILQFINNDFGVPSFMLRPKPPLSLAKSYAWEFLKARLGLLQRSYEDEHLVFSRFRNVEEEERVNVLKEYRYMVGSRGGRRAFDRLGQLAKERGIPVIIMTGSLQGDQKTVIRESADAWGFHVLDIAPVSDRVLARHGIPNTPEAVTQAIWVSPGDHHPNDFGHTIYVEGILETLETLGVIPRLASNSPPANATP